MADDRTTVTELATALGILGYPCIDVALAHRPKVMVNLTSLDWDRRLPCRPVAAGFDDGAAFLAAPAGPQDRVPVLIEGKAVTWRPVTRRCRPTCGSTTSYLISCPVRGGRVLPRPRSTLKEDLMSSRGRSFLAIFLAEAASIGVQDEPLFEESFVVISCECIDDALEKARLLAGQEAPYRSVSGSEVVWTRRLVSVGPTSIPVTEDGEIYSRFFRNGRAYAELEFEDFEPD